jgi:hypothetical protein
MTTGATGTGTKLSYIQSHNRSDDGAEIFGGAVNMKYYVATGADDDSIDVDTGAQVNVQFALFIPRSGRGGGNSETNGDS